jgi:hypothetical protein
MSEEKYAELISGGGIHIKRLPTIAKAKRMSHRKLIEILRLCPLSELFGEMKRKLSIKNLTEIGARIKVIQLIQVYGGDSGFNAIEELPSLYEASQGDPSMSNNIRRKLIKLEIEGSAHDIVEEEEHGSDDDDDDDDEEHKGPS